MQRRFWPIRPSLLPGNSVVRWLIQHCLSVRRAAVFTVRHLPTFPYTVCIGAVGNVDRLWNGDFPHSGEGLVRGHMSKQVEDVVSTKSEKASNAEEAYQKILSRLRNGEIGGIDRIVDTVLAAELNMSRMPAREALLRLVNEGYLVGSTRGFRLPELRKSDILEIFEIRKLLEPRAAAEAAVELNAEQLGELEAAFADANLAFGNDDPHAMFVAQVRFRNGWMCAVPNRRLVSIIERFFDQVNAVRQATLHDRESRRLSFTIAGRILDGFRKGDSLQVFEQMYSFVEQSRLRFVELNVI